MCFLRHSDRCDFDRAVVNAALMVSFEPTSNVVKNANLVIGGIGPKIKVATATTAMLKGK